MQTLKYHHSWLSEVRTRPLIFIHNSKHSNIITLFFFFKTRISLSELLLSHSLKPCYANRPTRKTHTFVTRSTRTLHIHFSIIPLECYANTNTNTNTNTNRYPHRRTTFRFRDFQFDLVSLLYSRQRTM